jgi:phosphoesterase RecJ-like protein
MIQPPDHSLFRELLDRSASCLIVTHVNPDGDALGSELGLARFLASRGKRVRIVNHDATPHILEFLTAEGPPIEVYEPGRHDAALRDADLICLVDNSAPDRLGRMERVMLAEAGHLLCVDHHPSRGTPWAHHILDEGACATAVLVYELVRECGWTPDRASAEALYVGLATDTGFFRYSSTNVRAHEVAADLLRLGVDPSGLYQAIYERNSEAYTRLLGHALAGVERFAGGAVAAARITLAQIEREGAEQLDTSEVTTSLLAMDGVRVALLFRELRGGRVKVSLRSKGAVDVHALAGEFGGGGHRNASGIVAAGDLAAVSRSVIDRAVALAAGRRRSSL